MTGPMTIVKFGPILSIKDWETSVVPNYPTKFFYLLFVPLFAWRKIIICKYQFKRFEASEQFPCLSQITPKLTPKMSQFTPPVPNYPTSFYQRFSPFSWTLAFLRNTYLAFQLSLFLVEQWKRLILLGNRKYWRICINFRKFHWFHQRHQFVTICCSTTWICWDKLDSCRSF